MALSRSESGDEDPRYAWRFYAPALILVTAPVVESARRYIASTALSPAELASDIIVTMIAAAAAACAVALLPGPHRLKGAAFTLSMLAAIGYPALADAVRVGPCTWGDFVLGTGLIVGLGLVIARLLRRTPLLLQSLNGAFWLAAAIFLFSAGYSAAPALWAGQRVSDRASLGGLAIALDPRLPAPDIIHVIIDGMGRLDELQDVYGIDSTRATRALNAQGLRIRSNAVANYSQTYLSVASMLSMDYLDRSAALAESDQDRTLTDAIIAQSSVIRALKARGYRFTLLSSGYQALLEHPLADDGIIGPTLLSEFEAYALRGTIFRVLPVRDLTFVPHRHRIREVLSALRNYAPAGQPRYILAHLLLPHPPFVFDAEGRDVIPPRLFTLADGSQFAGTPEEFKAGYSAQAKFVLATIDDLLGRWNHLPRSPIVIISGDHGPGLGYNVKTPLGSNTTGRMEVFLAVKGIEDASTLPASPVNLYRTVFNTRFGTTLPILPDRSFVSSWLKPYEWTEVHVDAP